MALVIAWPCAGPSSRVRRISRSRVPCRSSMCSFSSLVDILGDDTAVPVECQGECLDEAGLANAAKPGLQHLLGVETSFALDGVSEAHNIRIEYSWDDLVALCQPSAWGRTRQCVTSLGYRATVGLPARVRRREPCPALPGNALDFRVQPSVPRGSSRRVVRPKQPPRSAPRKPVAARPVRRSGDIRCRVLSR